MVITPFDFRTREIDSAIRFGYFAIEEAKEAIKEIEKSQKFDRAIRLFRTLSRKIIDYDYIRQSMDTSRLESKLIDDLKQISKDCVQALALLKKSIEIKEKQELVEAILKNLIALEKNINRILKKYEKQVAKGEELYAGIDGGGTKTVCVISKADGKVIGIGKGGPADPGQLQVGAIRSFNSIIISLKEACEKGGINFKTVRFERVCAGIVIRSKQIHRRVEELITKYFLQFYRGNIKDVIILPDHVVSWYATTKGKPGVIIEGGTGHRVYGFDPLNRKEADDNPFAMNRIENIHLSGRYVSYHAAKFLRRSRKSILRQVVVDAFNKGQLFRKYKARGFTLDQLLKDINIFFKVGHTTKVYKILEMNDIPELAKFVFIAAEKGDKAALNIILKGAKTMAKYVSFVAEAIGLHNKRFIIGLAGSVISNEISKIKLRKQIKFFEPAVQPEDIVTLKEPKEMVALKIAINNIRFY